MRLIKVGDLAVRLTGGNDGEGGGGGPLVVLCHGFGATGDDLVPLGGALDAPEAVRFAFPAAPPALGGQYGRGRAWWRLDVAALERAAASGVPRDLRDDDPVGLTEARAHLKAVVDGLGRGAPVVLGGFSQGAMLCLDLALGDPRPLAGLILLSASFLRAEAWRAGMAARAGLPVFQSHGRVDPLLSFELADELQRELTAAGLAVDFMPFEGQHEIPPAVLARAGAFIRRLAATSAS